MHEHKLFCTAHMGKIKRLTIVSVSLEVSLGRTGGHVSPNVGFPTLTHGPPSVIRSCYGLKAFEC